MPRSTFRWTLAMDQAISNVKIKLNRAIGIWSKLRHNSNLDIMKITYHSLFGLYLLYACHLWGQKNQTSLYQIQILQNRALRKMTFKKHHDSANSIFKEFHILKFKDLIYLQNCIFMLQIEQNKQLAASFPGLKYCGEGHNYMTWSTTKKLLHIPTNRTDRYGKQSAKYNSILDWNKFKKDFHGVNQHKLSHSKLKSRIEDHILNKYWETSETFVISNSAYMLCPLYFLLSFSFFFLPLSLPFISILHFFSTYLYYYFLCYKFIIL